MKGQPRLTVVKVGGGLSAIDGALERVAQAITAAAREHPLVIVPGGGPFADAVRAFGARHELSAGAAHWMAILAMDQYAQVLADRIAGADIVKGTGEIAEARARGRVPVLAPARWMRTADALPHTWEVTSDSVAAFVAGMLGARRLVLVKPSHGPVDHLVDGYFRCAVPVDLPVSILAIADIDRLEALLATGRPLPSHRS